MADGRHALDQQIERLRSLPGLVTRAAPAVALEMKRELASQASRGATPDGKAWAPTKDGRQALPKAAQNIDVEARGTVVVASVEGPYALHTQGRVRGGMRRQILPTGATPAPMTAAIDRVVTAEFRKTMGGAR